MKINTHRNRTKSFEMYFHVNNNIGLIHTFDRYNYVHLQKRKLRLREVKELGKNHKAI